MGYHFIPQRYLRGFEAKRDPGMIWMFDKKTTTHKLAPISKVAQSPEFYTDEQEDELTRNVEVPGNAVIDKIRQGHAISDDDRMHLTYYVATMIFRVPASRKKATKLVVPALSEITTQVRSALEHKHKNGEITFEVFQRKMREVDQYESNARIDPPQPIKDIMNSPWPFESALVIIRNMAWRIYQSTGPSFFLTSDNPAFFFEGIGLGKPESELTFPLCGDIVLHGSHQPFNEPKAIPTLQKVVKEFNRRIAFGADRFIFYHEKAPWIPSVAGLTDTRQLHRINWTE